MRAFRLVLGAAAALVGLVVVGVFVLFVSQPTSYRIARTRTIAASPERVRAQLVDVHALDAWTPWAPPPGPPPVVTFSAPSSGVGAWIDRRDADGNGARTTITAIADDRVALSSVTSGALGGGASTQTFELHPSASGTEVTWTLASDLSGLARLLWPFVGLEARVGPDMEAALGRLDHACASP